MTVRELTEKLTISEARKWKRYFADRPWPEEARDIQNAMLCAIVANLARGKDTPARTVTEFMVYARRPEETPEPGMTTADLFKRG
jgi:hypothetical protein